MADYIERFASNGRRIRFPKNLPKAKQDEFLASYGRDTGEQAVSQDKSLDQLVQMSNIPHGAKAGAPRQAAPLPQQYQNPPVPQQQQRPPQQEPNDRPLLFDPRMGPSQSANELGTELGISFILPPIGRAASVLGRTLGHMGSQGLLSALFHPEEALEKGATTAGITGVLHPLSELAGSSNKYARMIKRALVPVASSAASWWTAHKADLPASAQALAAVTGGILGPKLLSKFLSKENAMRPAAEHIAEHLTPEHVKAFEKGKKYGQHLTPAEASQEANLISQANRMGYTPKGAKMLQEHKGVKLKQEEKALENLKNKTYKPELEDALRNAAYSKLRKQEISPKSIEKIYKFPKRSIYEEPIIKEATHEKIAPKVKLIEPKRYEKEQIIAKAPKGFELFRAPKVAPEIIKPKVELAKAPGIEVPSNKLITPEQGIIKPQEKNLIVPPKKPEEKIYIGKPKAPVEFKQIGGEWMKPKFKLTEPGKTVKTGEAEVIREGGWRRPTQKEINEAIKRSFQDNGVPLAKNKTIQTAIDEVLSDKVWKQQLNKINPNNLYKNAKFLDLVKRNLHNAYTSNMRSGHDDKAKLIQKAEKSFIKQLEKSIPNYKKTRSLHERFKARETLEDLTSKGKTHGKALFKYLEDKHNKEELIKHLRHVPGAKKDVEALHDIFSKSRDINIEKLANALPDPTAGYSGNYKDDIVKFIMRTFKNGEYDKGAIELVTHPDWPNMVKELNKVTNKEKKMAKFFEYLSRTVSHPQALDAIFQGTQNKPKYDIEEGT